MWKNGALNEFDEDQTVNMSNKKGSSILVLNEDRYDNSSDEDGDRTETMVPSYSDLNVLEEVEEDMNLCNPMTRVILKMTVLMTRKKKFQQKMTNTKDSLSTSRCTMFYPTNQSFPIVGSDWIVSPHLMYSQMESF